MTSTMALGMPEVSGGRIRVPLRASGDARRLVLEDHFEAAYDCDLGAASPSLLLVPAIAALAPAAWVSGAELRTPLCDSTFFESLAAIRGVFAAMYPGVAWTGSVTADRLTADPGVGDRSAILFGGGVDSTATYLRRRAEDPLLVSVWGADVRLSEEHAWRTVEAAVDEFAQTQGARRSFVRTNTRDVTDGFAIRHAYGNGVLNDWWANVQHGLALLGLSAPWPLPTVLPRSTSPPVTQTTSRCRGARRRRPITSSPGPVCGAGTRAST
jgi:hypothetical protein